MQILQFHPLLKRICWGGTRLGTVLGKEIGHSRDCAESWEISDHDDDQSFVISGPQAGWSLSKLVTEQGRALFGTHAGLPQFPLLFKFLDANDRLSVQVHPNDEQAKMYVPTENGKTEAWVIIAAEPNSRVYAGLKSNIDKQKLTSCLNAGTVEECLHSFEVHVGDSVFIPAGTVHAIGEGILLAEVQQASDLTFRLYDWGRLGTDDQPRELHIDEALSCIDFERGPVNPVLPEVVCDDKAHRVEQLVCSRYFIIQRHTATSPFNVVQDDRFHVFMMLDGNARVVCDGETRQVVTGQTFLIPAECEKVCIEPIEEATLLETFPP